MKEHSLTEGRIGSTLLRFAVPFLIASLLQALYGAADLFVVGQFADSSAVSAVAIGSQVMQTITGIILGISMGGTVLIGKRIGEQNEKGAATAVGNLAVLFLLLAVLITPVMIIFTNTAVTLMHTPAEAVHATRQYLLICACGIPFIIGYNAVSGIFRGLGDSKTPVYFIAAACVINIVVDFILAGALHMGAKGAAIATVLAQGISFTLAFIYMKKKGFSFPFHRYHLRPDRYSLLYILKVGLPLALQDALVNVSFLIITAIINTMGIIASAAVGVVEKLIVFAMLPPTSFASAVATMTAQNMGAKKPERALRALYCGVGFSLIFGFAVCLYSQFLPETLTGMFSNDPRVIETAAQYLRSYSIDCILVSFIFCMNSYFSGCGKSIISMIHSMIATFAVRIPLSYFLSQTAGSSLYSIGFAAPAASLVSILICFGYFAWSRRRTTSAYPQS